MPLEAKTLFLIVTKQRKTYREVNELLFRRELDFALICSGLYAAANEEFGAQIRAVDLGKLFQIDV